MAVGRIDGVATLRAYYGLFAGTKYSGHNNEVAVLTGWPR